MAEDVNVAIIRPDFEAPVSDSMPLVQDLLHFILRPASLPWKFKAQWAFVRPITGITLDFKFRRHGNTKAAPRPFGAASPNGEAAGCFPEPIKQIRVR